MKINIKLLFLTAILSVLTSCSKEPGTGGTSTITGKVYLKKYNFNFTVLISEYPIHDERVYLIYGEDDIYSEDFRTHYDGSYRFSNLKKGRYQVFVYSEDSSGTSPSGYIPVIKNIEVTKNNQHVEADTIYIISN